MKSPWLAEILGFLIIFVAVVIVAGLVGQDVPAGLMKEVGLNLV